MGLQKICDWCKLPAMPMSRVPYTTPEGRKVLVSVKIELDEGHGVVLKDQDTCLNCGRKVLLNFLGGRS